jgi:hypothetical protein
LQAISCAIRMASCARNSSGKRLPGLNPCSNAGSEIAVPRDLPRHEQQPREI